jgi:hypothetical protein
VTLGGVSAPCYAGASYTPTDFWCRTAFSQIPDERTFSADGLLLVQIGLLVQGHKPSETGGEKSVPQSASMTTARNHILAKEAGRVYGPGP